MQKYSEYYPAITGKFADRDLKQIKANRIISVKQARDIASMCKSIDERFIGVQINDLQYAVRKHAHLIQEGKPQRFVEEVRKCFLRDTEGRYGEKDVCGRPVGLAPDFYGLENGQYLIIVKQAALLVTVCEDKTIRLKDARSLL